MATQIETYKGAVEAFVVAAERHAEAEGVMVRAQVLFGRLARRMPEDAAYEAAGVNLADRRSLQAYAQEREAMLGLIEAAVAGPTWRRLGTVALIAWHRERPQPANRNPKHRKARGGAGQTMSRAW